MTAPFRGSAASHSRGRLAGPSYTSLSRDLYVVGGDKHLTMAALDISTRVAAARTLLPDDVIGHVTSLLLTKVTVDDDGLVHLLRKPGSSRSTRQGIEVHRVPWEADELMTMKGIVMTRGPRALADLAATFTVEELVQVGDQLAGRYKREELDLAVERAVGRPGVDRLREAVPLLDKDSRSPAETRARLRLHAAGFTALRHKVIVTDEANGWYAESDLGDPVAKVLLQHEGAIHFRKGEKQRINDISRDDSSRSMGWQVVNSTAIDDAHPGLLIRKMTEAYLRQAQLLGPLVLPDHLVELFLRRGRPGS